MLHGLYFFGDFCTGTVWSFNPASLGITDRTAELGAAAGVGFNLVAFGEDGSGRPLIVQSGNGRVYRFSAVPRMGCGFGPELALLMPALAAARRWRVRSTALAA